MKENFLRGRWRRCVGSHPVGNVALVVSASRALLADGWWTNARNKPAAQGKESLRRDVTWRVAAGVLKLVTSCLFFFFLRLEMPNKYHGATHEKSSPFRQSHWVKKVNFVTFEQVIKTLMLKPFTHSHCIHTDGIERNQQGFQQAALRTRKLIRKWINGFDNWLVYVAAS